MTGLLLTAGITPGTIQATNYANSIPASQDLGTYTAPTESVIYTIPGDNHAHLLAPTGGYALAAGKFVRCHLWAALYSTSQNNTHLYVGIVAQQRAYPYAWVILAYDQAWFNNSGDRQVLTASRVVDGDTYSHYGPYGTADWQDVAIKEFSFNHDVRDW